MAKSKWFLLTFVFVLGFFISNGLVNAQVLPSGCTSGALFSSTTGQPCGNTANVGCNPGDLFSSMTGQPCSSVSSGAPTNNIVLNRVLTVGMKGTDIVPIQQFLKDKGYYAGMVDGAYGPITAGSVRYFQEKNGIPTTSTIDTQTLNLINSMRGVYNSYTNSPSLNQSNQSNPETCYVTNGVRICHNNQDESIFFDTPDREVAYNVQNIRNGSTYTTVYHTEGRGKTFGSYGDSIKVGTSNVSYKMPTNRNFSIWGTQTDFESLMYSKDGQDWYKSTSGAGNPMVVSGLPGDSYKYIFFLAVKDDNRNHQTGENDFRHYLLQARTLDYQNFDILVGNNSWKPFNDQTCQTAPSYCRPTALTDTEGGFVRSNYATAPYETQGLIGSVVLVNGTYYYFYGDYDASGQTYSLYYRTAKNLANGVVWSAAQKISKNNIGLSIIRVAKAKGMDRWVVMYNCKSTSKGWQDVCLQYTNNLNVIGTGGLSDLKISNSSDGFGLGMKGVIGTATPTDFSQIFWMTDPNGNLASPSPEDGQPNRGGEIYWSNFYLGPSDPNHVYGGKVWRAGWSQTLVGTTTQPSITVLSPNGGESYKVGDTMYIKWSSTGFSSTGQVEIIVEDTRKVGDTPEHNVLDVMVPNSGSYAWKIPASTPYATLGAGNVYKVWVRNSEGMSVGAVEDSSNGLFSITSVSTPVPPLTITTPSPLPNAKVGVPYSVALNVSGGSGPYVWTTGEASFPVSGLGFTSSYGNPMYITGIPSKIYVNGVEQTTPYTFNFNVTVNSGSQTITKQFTLTVNPADGIPASVLSITTPSPLPNAKVGQAYSTTISATGGSNESAYSWQITSGSLPPGITEIRMDCMTIVGYGCKLPFELTGTPTTAGTYTLTMKLTADYETTRKTFTITVQPADVVNSNVIGFLDAANCSIIGGWALDLNNTNRELGIKIYSSSSTSSKNLLLETSTRGLRPDVNAAYGVSGNHGYTVFTPNSIKDGNTYLISVTAEDPNFQLIGSPKSVNCPTIGVLGVESFTFTLPLQKGSTGNEVMELQKYLNNGGYNAGLVDGLFGTQVHNALIRFQVANSLIADGIVGPEVRALLNK